MDRQDKVKQEAQKEPVQRGISKWVIIQWVLIPLLLIVALGGGLAVGYVVLGKRELSEALQWSTWRHVYDLVFAP